MLTPTLRRTCAIASGLAVVAVLGGPGGVAASPHVQTGDGASGPVVSASGMGAVRVLGMSEVVDVSKNGRYVLGMLAGRYVVRDVVKNKTLRKLPTSEGIYEYFGISDNGRYVSYTYTTPSGTSSCNAPWVRDRKTNKARPMATTAAGKALKPAWTPSSSTCPDEPSWREQVTYSEPSLSGNGRYVGFCGNLTLPDRLDLYVKDRKTGKLKTWPGVCSEITSDFEWPTPPQVSETGKMVLLPGLHASGEDVDWFKWEPASMLVAGVLQTGVGGRWPLLTDDGSAVYSVSPNACDSVDTPCPGGPIRYDTASGATVALPASDPGPAPMSRRGRYAVSITGPSAARSLGIYDRTTAVTTDLTPVFAALAVTIPDSDSRTRLSGDGRVVFMTPNAGTTWYALTWM